MSECPICHHYSCTCSRWETECYEHEHRYDMSYDEQQNIRHKIDDFKQQERRQEEREQEEYEYHMAERVQFERQQQEAMEEEEYWERLNANNQS